MRWIKPSIRILILFLLLAEITSLAYAQYDIGTTPLPNTTVIEGGASKNVSFWELPLWIQIAFVTATVIALLGAFKLFPIFIGKLKHLVENKRRNRIYAYIQSNPGSTVRDISRDEDINIGTVKYHVYQLDIAKRIVPKKIGKFLRLFQNSNIYSDKEQLVLSACKNETGKSILFYIKDNPGATNKQIADRFDIKESTAHWYMDSYIRECIVNFVKDGKLKKYYLEDDTVKIMQKLGINK
jgi:predicted transcriptional regulator